MMSKGRKTKPGRSTKAKSPGQQSHPFTGAYENPRLVHVLLSLMGKKCQTKVRNGGIYDGVFHAFNPNMDVSMDAVHKRNTEENSSASTNGDVSPSDCPKEEELIGQMMFQSEKLVSVSFEDVDLSYAELEINETNGESTALARLTSKGGEKKLEPWNGGGDSLEDDSIGGLEDGLSAGVNGWGAEQMFRANEEKYGVKSDYDSSLSNYTMALDIKDTEEDSERVARAARLAQEIESQSDYKQRIEVELDDGVTEEDKFSAVSRDRELRRDVRDPRDVRDRELRDNREHYRDRDKDRGDRERDPLSPQGFRNKHEYDRFHQPNRNRGRGRDSRDWDKRNQNYMGPPRSGGPGGPPPMSGRNQPPMSQMDGPPGPGGMGKYRPSEIPPRLQRSGSGGHSGSLQREDDRMRQHGENNSMHHAYSQVPKGQRQPRTRPGQGQRGWNITSPPGSEYPHHSPPAQMHQDPAVISAGPARTGGPSLSRTSSSSSNTSAGPQGGHQKHLSSSSQDDQTHAPRHHQHQRQQQQGPASPTTAPQPNSNQGPVVRPHGMPSNPTLPGKAITGPVKVQSAMYVQKKAQFTHPRILKRQDRLPSSEQAVTAAAPVSPMHSEIKSKHGVVTLKDTAKQLHAGLKVTLTPDRPREVNASRGQSFKPAVNHEANWPSLSPRRKVVVRDDPESHMPGCDPASRRPEVPAPIRPRLHPVRIAVNNQIVPVCQQPRVQYYIVHGPPVIPECAALIPMHNPPADEQNTSWSSIVSRNASGQKPMMGPGPEMAQPHVHQGPPQPQQGPMSHPPAGMPHVVSVSRGAKYTWTPRGGTPPTSSMPTPYPSAGQGGPMPPNMTSPRLHQHPHGMPQMGDHAVPHMQGQMMARPPPPQQAMVASPPQMPMSTQPSPRTNKMPPKMPAQTGEPARQKPEKPEDEGNQNRKKSLEPPQSQAVPPGTAKNRNGSPSFTELKQFGENFKLSSDVKTKETPPLQGTAQQPHQTNKAAPRQPMNVPQTSPSMARGPAFTGPGPQQPGYQPPPQQTYAVAATRPEQGPPLVGGQMAGQMTPVVVQQQPKQVLHQQQAQMHPQAYPQIHHHQIPVAAANIQHFGTQHTSVPPAQVQNMQAVVKSPRSPDGMQQPPGRPMIPAEKMAASPQPMKPMMSPKQDMQVHNVHQGNIHIATQHPQHTTASAVITVSAVPGSPIIASQYTATAQMIQGIPRNSPTGPQGAVAVHVSSPAEMKPAAQPTSPTTTTPSITSPTSAGPKALNPEAMEFKPRTPAKPQARATTPQIPPPSVYMQMPGQITQVYNTGQQQLPFEPSHMPAALQQHMVAGQPYPTSFQQPVIFQTQPAQHVVQQMQGQQPPMQFAFDQSPVYANPAGQAAMMPQNARVAAIPSNQPAHMPQYQADQAGPMYVPIAQGASMQPNFLQQTRPQSAHTPTQAPHVTAASPANTSSQQPQQPAGHPTPQMTQMWMQIPGNNNAAQYVMHPMPVHPAVNQNPQQPQAYLNPVNSVRTQMPISGVTAQQKGQAGAIAAAQYITQQSPGQYQYQQAPPSQ